eukprot:5944807-Heterocapsa_arctica.AAC.1
MSPLALSRALARILRHEVDRGRVPATSDGFVTFRALLARPDISASCAELRQAATTSISKGDLRFELKEDPASGP